MNAGVITPQAGAVRQMRHDDLPAVVMLHMRALEVSFVCRLGGAFVQRLQEVMLQHEATVALVATDGARIRGFAIATTDAASFERFSRSRLLPRLAFSLARRPQLIPRVVASLTEKRHPSGAELLLLAVDEGCQRAGVGTRLLAELEAEFVGRGIVGYTVAVRTQFEAALRFYARAGFRDAVTVRVFGMPMTYLRRDLSV